MCEEYVILEEVDVCHQDGGSANGPSSEWEDNVEGGETPQSPMHEGDDGNTPLAPDSGDGFGEAPADAGEFGDQTGEQDDGVDTNNDVSQPVGDVPANDGGAPIDENENGQEGGAGMGGDSGAEAPYGDQSGTPAGQDGMGADNMAPSAGDSEVTPGAGETDMTPPEGKEAPPLDSESPPLDGESPDS
jgi:hypothetical protein